MKRAAFKVGDRVEWLRERDSKGGTCRSLESGTIDWIDEVQAAIIPDGHKFPRRWLVSVERLKPYHPPPEQPRLPESDVS